MSSKVYAIQVTGLFIFSLVLFGIINWVNDTGNLFVLVKLVKIGTLFWLGITIAIMIINHLYLSSQKRRILNIINWLLSILMLGIFSTIIMRDINHMVLSFNCLPTFAFLVSLIAIIQFFKNKIKG